MRKSLFLSLFLLTVDLLTLAATIPSYVVKSPNGVLSFELIPGKRELSFTVHAGKVLVVGLSPLRFLLDGVILTEGATIRDDRRYKLSEQYPWLGVHSVAINAYNGLELHMMHGSTPYTLDIRVFNDGAAFRIVVPGADSAARVPDEATVFNFPGTSSLWYHDLVGHYEGVHVKKELSQVQAGEWGGIYVAVTEAALQRYSGMALQADGISGLVLRMAQHQPASHPLYNVLDYGAKGDGKTLDGDAINKTIEAAAKAGGGTVFFPAGSYLTYTIRLASNISLYIDQGATIIAAAPVNKVGYDNPEPNPFDKYQDYGHSHWKNSLIYGEGLHDISILGQGLIWGRDLTRSTNVPEGGGNKAISLKLCHNVTIRDVSVLHGGHFAILATGVDNLTIDNMKVDTDRDGFDIDCCKNVRVSNCTVNSPYDDGICLKSSFGLGYARATENVTITNCQVSGYDEGTLLDGTFKRNHKKYSDSTTTGRIKMGTESNGGFKNVTISNCVFDYSRGLALETVDGGLLEDVTITNITMRDIVNAPVFIRLGARMRAPDTMSVGVCRRIILSNIVVYNADYRHGAIISGLPGHPIEDLEMSNIRIYYKGGGTADMADREVPEFEKDYPEPYRWGKMPAYGFFIRHVKDVRMHDVAISFMSPEQRPAFILDDVEGADLHRVRAQKADGFYTIDKHIDKTGKIRL